MWIHGKNSPYHIGNFGIKGVSSPANMPPSLYEACEWTDLNGNFWLLGGLTTTSTVYAALWKYEPATNQWTWMNGPATTNAPGHYGTLGIPDIANYPPSRAWGGVTWVDSSGFLWLYGGASSSANSFSDLWKYNIGTNEWTWIKGPTTFNQQPIFGTQGIPNISNTPGCRAEIASSWSDNAGNLWLFGGHVSGSGPRNDLWNYNILNNMWTWMKGNAVSNHPGSYGTKGIEAANNLPPARWSFSHWKDLNGNFWVFGGSNYDSSFFYNDLWRYNPLSNNWTWMKGDSIPGGAGSYGAKCLTSPGDLPSGRHENRATIIDGAGNFWMYGGGQSGTTASGDLWMYCVFTNAWTWVSGSSSFANPWGILNVPNPLNQPGSRKAANAWYDAAGNICVFGGSAGGTFNDLWRFTINEECGNACDMMSAHEYQKTSFGIKVYPIPFTSTLTFNANSDNPFDRILVFSPEGKIIASLTFSSSTIINIDMSDFSAGIYFFNCYGIKGNEIVKAIKY